MDGIVSRLASQPSRPEATIQADIYALLIAANIGLNDETVTTESPVEGGRIDVEIGQCVIEVKKNLSTAVLPKAEEQLAGYVRQRSDALGRYVGILTDGAQWRLYHLNSDALELVSEHRLNKNSPDTKGLLVWLESVMSTLTAIKPLPEEIEHRLGADSPAHQLDAAELHAIYTAHASDKDIQLKRQLWAKLLRTALGAEFVDSEELFINHTLLVTTAELIAHAVLNFDVGPSGTLTARQITSGTEFANARIRGVVEADFFDWVTDTPDGESFVRNLGRRVARFDWSAVEHDVLKVLYESVITKAVREKLGEYYTPDWLADRMVNTFIPAPLDIVAADPACGSGTFLFHAIRHYLAAAEAAGVDTDEAVQKVTAHVIGLDVHPVAVTLARVTYLLALGRDNINSPNRKELTIPVYLGDSIQWRQETDMFTTEVVRVRTDDTDLFGDPGGLLFPLDLCFPRSVLKDATQFDYLVSEMADKALTTDPKDAKKAVVAILKRRGIAPDSTDGDVLRETFLNLCTLRAQGRNHIWGYYVRNLIRPLWLAEPENSVDIVIGNPPWLRYNKMPPSMQKNYLELAKPRNLLTGGLGASARDLSTLFAVRAVELYLRTGGAFAFVMPHGVLTRKPHTGFRTGNWSTRHGGHLTVKFAPPWDLDNVTTGFPMTSCVVHGRRATDSARMPTTTLAWIGRLPRSDLPWSDVSAKITTTTSTVSALDHGTIAAESPYKSRFRDGAILYPRPLMFVVDAPKVPLGAGAGRRAVTSFRSALEKLPWKDCPSITANVETAFIRPAYLGEQVLPFRTLAPREIVLPITDSAILTPDGIDLHAGLSAWWTGTETAWAKGRKKTETSPLSERIDYHGQLSAQLPTSPTRVVYTKSGNTLAAAIVRDKRAVIDHTLYWMPALVEDEAHYLCAILNSAPLLAQVKPLQAIGLFGRRHFDKNVFAMPFPTFNPDDLDHSRLVALGRQAEQEAATVDVSRVTTFQAARKIVRKHLADKGVEADIVAAVTQLLLSSL